MDESQLIIDYTPPTWRGWLFKLLDCSVEYLLLLIVFGVLLGLATGRVYQSPFGPMHLDMLVFFGLMLVQIEI